jgi:nicotinamidase-related amidase
MMHLQGHLYLPRADAGDTDPELLTDLKAKDADILNLTKVTRSCFKCEQAALLVHALKAHEITEIHFVGFDIYDYVLASAYDAIDLGYFAYVIEEACTHIGQNRNWSTRR